MRTLKPVLCVKELPAIARRRRQGLPSIQDFIAESPADNEARLVEYMKGGVLIAILNDGGSCRDVISATHDSIPKILAGERSLTGDVCLTDGVWYWMSAFIFYVERYHLRMNSDFVAHACQSKWAVNANAFSVSDLDAQAVVTELFQPTE